MEYFGGAGVRGELHPSLRIYIDCFESAPFPKAFPRGGGIWDQDPILMQHFRFIREYEVNWKRTQQQLRDMQNRNPVEATMQDRGGGNPGLEDLLNEMLQEEGLEDDARF